MPHRHKWAPEPTGNKENLGCFDIGGGRMVFREECECGSTRRTTVNYARPSGQKGLDIIEVTTKGVTRTRKAYR